MTTVAYRSGIMAADSRCTAHKTVVGRIRKIYRLSNGGLYGHSGSADFRSILELVDKIKSPKFLPSVKEIAATQCEARGILVFPRGQAFYLDVDQESKSGADRWTGSIVEISEDFAAVGSGSDIALGALAHGASAERAVGIACRFDVDSGTPVMTMMLKQTVKRESK